MSSFIRSTPGKILTSGLGREALKSMFPEPPEMPTYSNEKNSQAAEAAAREEAKNLKKRRGQMSMIATSPEGVTGGFPGFSSKLGGG